MGGAASGAAGLVILVVGFLIFLVLREVWCWYWKLNAMLEELQAISAYLKAMHDRDVGRAQRVGPSTAPTGDGFPPIR